MAKVRVVGTVRVGGRTLPVKKVPQLAPIVVGAVMEATATQLRVLAEETRELIVDRLFAAEPQAPGRSVVARPSRLVAENMPSAPRSPASYPPLSRQHAAKKARQGSDGRFLIERGDYLEGIEIFKGQQRSGVYYMVRLQDREHVGADPSSKPIRLSLLAKVHEFGSSKHKIPPRPHWRPAVRDVRRAFGALRPTIKAAALRIALRRIT